MLNMLLHTTHIQRTFSLPCIQRHEQNPQPIPQAHGLCVCDSLLLSYFGSGPKANMSPGVRFSLATGGGACFEGAGQDISRILATKIE